VNLRGKVVVFVKVFLTSRPNVKDNAHTLQVLLVFELLIHALKLHGLQIPSSGVKLIWIMKLRGCGRKESLPGVA